LLGAISLVANTRSKQIVGATGTAPILPSELFGRITGNNEKES
jgi:hypothetical protein